MRTNCISPVRCRAIALTALGLVLWTPAARGHFPWLAVDEQGRALAFFGETSGDRTYKLPESVAAATVKSRTYDGKTEALEMESVEEDDFIGRRSLKPVKKNAALEMTVQYGLYHGMLLNYYAKHLPDPAAASPKQTPSDGLKLQVTPSISEQGLEFAVVWQGKPLEGAGLALSNPGGDEEPQEASTDGQGRAVFKYVHRGPVGVIVSFTDDDATGELDGEQYTSAAHYATLTFNNPRTIGKPMTPEPKKRQRPEAEKAASAYPPLEEPLSSFGGAVCDGWLYVYGGHIGKEHAHSRENLSQSFRRLNLSGGGEWESLPMETPLQGLPLVAHGGKVYRVGGMSARNSADEDESLHSVDEFAVYDPETRQWTALAPLPEPRSSHDAVVIGDTLYVAGGWTLDGDRAGEWLDTAWSFDLSDPQGQWRPLPSPGFHRRALALAHWQGKVVAIGGLDEDAIVSQGVHCLDPSTGKWTSLPDLPGEGRVDGFGVSAWNLDGTLYASGTQPHLYRLAADGTAWEPAGKLEQPRFFHRLLPAGSSSLVAVAGASMDGHLATIDRIVPQPADRSN